MSFMFVSSPLCYDRGGEVEDFLNRMFGTVVSIMLDQRWDSTPLLTAPLAPLAPALLCPGL